MASWCPLLLFPNASPKLNKSFSLWNLSLMACATLYLPEKAFLIPFEDGIVHNPFPPFSHFCTFIFVYRHLSIHCSLYVLIVDVVGSKPSIDDANCLSSFSPSLLLSSSAFSCMIHYWLLLFLSQFLHFSL